MTEPTQAPRSFVTGTVSPEGQIQFRYNGAWSDLFTLLRLIGLAVDSQYMEEQKKMAAATVVPPPAPAPPRQSFAERRERKKK